MQPTHPLIASLLACGLAAQDVQKPSSRPAPASRPAKRPASATGDAAALALAAKVSNFAGGAKGWAKVDNITFTFLGQRRLLWDRRAGKVRIETMARPGRRPGRGATWGVLVYDIAKDKGTLLNGKTGRSGATRYAKGAWINDFYWLLVPLKVLDPGVRLSIDEPKDSDAKGMQRLRLRFDKVGLTPRNEYVLHVDSKTGKVLRWDYYGTADSRPRSWDFAGYARVGPLRLSLKRPMAGTERAFALSDVRINVQVPEDAWTAKKAILTVTK